jgi:hypothetical protein
MVIADSKKELLKKLIYAQNYGSSITIVEHFESSKLVVNMGGHTYEFSKELLEDISYGLIKKAAPEILLTQDALYNKKTFGLGFTEILDDDWIVGKSFVSNGFFPAFSVQLSEPSKLIMDDPEAFGYGEVIDG